jgi:hypothetical protein
MKFISLVTTEDGRLQKGWTYMGGFVWKTEFIGHSGIVTGGLRIVVFDGRGEWMTFDPKVFIASEPEYGEGA